MYNPGILYSKSIGAHPNCINADSDRNLTVDRIKEKLEYYIFTKNYAYNEIGEIINIPYLTSSSNRTLLVDERTLESRDVFSFINYFEDVQSFIFEGYNQEPVWVYLSSNLHYLYVSSEITGNNIGSNFKIYKIVKIDIVKGIQYIKYISSHSGYFLIFDGCDSIDPRSFNDFISRQPTTRINSTKRSKIDNKIRNKYYGMIDSYNNVDKFLDEILSQKFINQCKKLVSDN